ncbi:hydrogenase subunit MbhD domain-containing protein [Thermococcus sp. 2319x1]|uniref:hydrogenase subunit MbhD domain-containing protein n=1 Tax=Thermococcus sp. 2319x1 TaxID=1674923 RepID=UPI0015841468|nr:hydrogenase subunit MbhD domain-containing protein [Thermococcus sp. 2319x1]
MPGIILDILLLTMILLSIAVVEEENLVSAVVKYAFLSLAFVLVLALLKAPDVALSAIVVGAVVIGVFLFTIREVEK